MKWVEWKWKNSPGSGGETRREVPLKPLSVGSSVATRLTTPLNFQKSEWRKRSRPEYILRFYLPELHDPSSRRVGLGPPPLDAPPKNRKSRSPTKTVNFSSNLMEQVAADKY